MRKFLILVISLSIISCGAEQKVVNDWVGKNATQLRSKWGYPTRVLMDTLSNEIYQYIDPFFGRSYGRNGGKEREYHIVSFYLHPDGVIYNTRIDNTESLSIDYFQKKSN